MVYLAPKRLYAPATIRWTKGKGLIGRCWEHQQNVGANTAEEWGDDELTEQEWGGLDDDLRYGFTYEEYLKVREYGAVAAAPIIDDDGRYLGCISIDSPGPAFELVMDPLVLEALHDGALWIKQTAINLSRA